MEHENSISMEIKCIIQQIDGHCCCCCCHHAIQNQSKMLNLLHITLHRISSTLHLEMADENCIFDRIFIWQLNTSHVHRNKKRKTKRRKKRKIIFFLFDFMLLFSMCENRCIFIYLSRVHSLNEIEKEQIDVHKDRTANHQI